MSKTHYPPSPYAGNDHCLGCGQHWLDHHSDGCVYTPPPRWS